MSYRYILLILLSSAGLCGCAVRRYRPAPISPAATAAALGNRSLSSPQLHAYIERTLGRAPSADAWGLPQLTLAAFYFNPEIEIAKARVAEAKAATVTAGARPNPSVTGSVGGETSPASPWLASLGFTFPWETAGKRGYRISRAERLAEAARWQLAAVAWHVRSQLRGAVLEYVMAGQDLKLLNQQESIRREQVKLLEQRLAVGMIPLPEVDTARIQHTQAVLAAAAAEGRVSQARAALAAAIGIPVAGLGGLRIVWPEFDHLPPGTAFPSTQIKEDAVLNRIDIHESLAAYAASEAALQLEIAKQYPDIELGPGYEFNEGDHGFALGFSLTLPLLNRNQGPIAEAEAARKQAAAQFLAVQAAGVAASEQALARYQSSLKEVAEARRVAGQSLTRQRATEKAFDAGEADRLAVNGSRLQVLLSTIAEQDAVYRAQQALGSLEDAVQRPLTPNDLEPTTPQSPALQGRSTKP